MHGFYEFFAGGGMARAGLGDRWDCLFANDFSPMKAAAYRANWTGDHFHEGDVAKVTPDMLPEGGELVWASFPCQDLSLAGDYRGLGDQRAKEKTRSGTFWLFWALMRGLIEVGRAPRLIVLENVHGTLRSNGGRDFAAIAGALSGADYKCGAILIDAKWFLPQSRPRLFIVAVRRDVVIPPALRASTPDPRWHPPALIEAVDKVSAEARKKWVWWKLAYPPMRRKVLADMVEKEPTGVSWHTPDETAYILSLMSDVNIAKVEEAKKSGTLKVGTIYRRTRIDEVGKKVQRAEVRFDDIAGCLRTPAGGSSRQTLLIVEGQKVRSRLLSPREAANLMGLPKKFKLPKRYNDAYHLAGDGVAVPVVRHLAAHILEPLVAASAPVAVAAE
jgi:DNA (cytosine-5)-methyltransferase 1